MSEATVEQYEAAIADAKEVMAQRDLLTRLTQVPEFRKLIIEGFCKDEAARFAHISTDPNISETARKDALGTAQAAGYLKRWMNAIILMGNQAQKDISDYHAEIEELRAEEA